MGQSADLTVDRPRRSQTNCCTPTKWICNLRASATWWP